MLENRRRGQHFAGCARARARRLPRGPRMQAPRSTSSAPTATCTSSTSPSRSPRAPARPPLAPGLPPRRTRGGRPRCRSREARAAGRTSVGEVCGWDRRGASLEAGEGSKLPSTRSALAPRAHEQTVKTDRPLSMKRVHLWSEAVFGHAVPFQTTRSVLCRTVSSRQRGVS